MEIELISSPISYGENSDEKIFFNDGSLSLNGADFGDLETGEESAVKYFYFRHTGAEPIYNVGIYMKAVGISWGGYVDSFPDSKLPYNPNFFRSGGLTSNGFQTSSTQDYEFMRQSALSNPDMGIRLHLNKSNELIKTYGLGYDNKGLSFSPITLKSTSLDFSRSSNQIRDGYIYPEPEDSSKTSKDGDEAKIGVSIRIPEDTIGSGHIQFSIALKYRYTI